jgi:hypothetical protein
MKKFYEEAEIEIVKFETADVITTSCPDYGKDPCGIDG